MSKKCFLICPIGENGSEVRRVSDIVLKYIVTPVCSEFGYEIIRSDTEFTANNLNDDIFNHLDNDELAIADLTGHNPNVFYEAGYRKAKGLPLIHIAKEGTVLPFDIKTIRTYFYDIAADKVEIAKDSLRKVIGNIRESSNSDTCSNAVVSAELTRDSKKLLKALYRDYVAARSLGSSRTEAAAFTDISQIGKLSNMNNKEDVIELIMSLSVLGYLKYDSDDNFNVFIGRLTDKGIKYGEDNFDEPTYIVLLREIIKQYNLRKAYIMSDKFVNYSSDDFAVLVSKGFIDQSKYINGSFSVKPTNAGIAEIVSRDNI